MDNRWFNILLFLFMFLASTNFVLSYFMFKAKFSKVLKDEELRLYFYFILGFTIIACLIVYFQATISVSSIEHPMVMGRFESAFRHALFQVLTIVTTTGYISADYTLWTPFLTLLFFSLMFLGASSGSTSGGIKIVRHLIMIKTGITEFKKTIHPHAILPIRYNRRVVQQPIVSNILAFFIFLYPFVYYWSIRFFFIGVGFSNGFGRSNIYFGKYRSWGRGLRACQQLWEHSRPSKMVGMFFNAHRTSRTIYRIYFIDSVFLEKLKKYCNSI